MRYEMNSIIGIFGMSGVGKSWLASRLSLSSKWSHAKASDLLKQIKLETSEELRTGLVLDNQSLLIQAFDKYKKEHHEFILFDGHSIIDSDNGYIEIPKIVICRLGIEGIVFVYDDPQIISTRRMEDKGRTRPNRSIENLADYQEKAKAVCVSYDVPLIEVRSGDQEAFARAVDEIENM